MSDNSTLGIIAGSGRFPLQLVEACHATGRPCFVVALENAADIEAISHVPHAVVRIGAVGEALEHLRKTQAKEMVLAGSVRRPSLLSLRPDFVGTKLLARLGAAFFSGDDALLKALVSFSRKGRIQSRRLAMIYCAGWSRRKACSAKSSPMRAPKPISRRA